MHPKYQQADLAMSDIHASQQAFRRHTREKACAARFFIAPSCATEQEIASLR